MKLRDVWDNVLEYGAIAGAVVLAAGALGGVGYGMYYGIKKSKAEEAVVRKAQNEYKASMFYDANATNYKSDEVTPEQKALNQQYGAPRGYDVFVNGDKVQAKWFENPEVIISLVNKDNKKVWEHNYKKFKIFTEAKFDKVADWYFEFGPNKLEKLDRIGPPNFKKIVDNLKGPAIPGAPKASLSFSFKDFVEKEKDISFFLAGLDSNAMAVWKTDFIKSSLHNDFFIKTHDLNIKDTPFKDQYSNEFKIYSQLGDFRDSQPTIETALTSIRGETWNEPAIKPPIFLPGPEDTWIPIFPMSFSALSKNDLKNLNSLKIIDTGLKFQDTQNSKTKTSAKPKGVLSRLEATTGENIRNKNNSPSSAQQNKTKTNNKLQKKNMNWSY